MSKSLRVFFLSALVVLLAAAAAAAFDVTKASLRSFDIVLENVSGANTWNSPNSWQFASWPGSGDASKSFDVINSDDHKVYIRLDVPVSAVGLNDSGDIALFPGSFASMDAQIRFINNGTYTIGNNVIKGYIMSIDVSNNQAVTITITNNATVKGSWDITVGEGASLTLGGRGTLNLSDAGLTTPRKWSFGDKKTFNISGLDISGDVILDLNVNKLTTLGRGLKGRALSVDLMNQSTLTVEDVSIFNNFTNTFISSDLYPSVLSLGSGTYNGVNTFVISLDNTSSISVPENNTATLTASKDTIFIGSTLQKTGAGTLDFRASSATLPLSSDVTKIKVDGGTLKLTAYRTTGAVRPVWSSDKGLSIEVAKDAKLILTPDAIRGSLDIEIQQGGEVELGGRSVIKGTSPIAYTTADSADAEVKSRNINDFKVLMGANSKLTVNGAEVFTEIRNIGTNVTNAAITASGDNAVIILSNDANGDAFSKFVGTVAASELVLIGEFNDYPFAKTANTDAVKKTIIYAPGYLSVSDDITELGTIALREGHNNYQGQVGKLNVLSGDISVDELDVDAAAEAAIISLDNKATLSVTTLKLYANGADGSEDGVKALDVAGDGTLKIDKLEDNTESISEKVDAITVRDKATLSLGDNLTEKHGITVIDATLEAKNGVTISGSVKFDGNSKLKTSVKGSNREEESATSYAIKAASVEMTNSSALSLDIDLDDDTLSDKAYKRGTQYKVLSADKLTVTANIKGDGVNFKYEEMEDKGIGVELIKELQQVSFGEISYDKYTFKKGSPIEIVVPVIYSKDNEVIPSHYAKYLKISSEEKKGLPSPFYLDKTDLSNVFLSYKGNVTEDVASFTIIVGFDLPYSSGNFTSDDISTFEANLASDRITSADFIPQTFESGQLSEDTTPKVDIDSATDVNTYMVASNDILEFIVSGIRVDFPTARPVLLKDVYVWLNNAVGDTYSVRLADGNWDKVSGDIKVYVDNQQINLGSDAISAEGNTAVKIAIPTNMLGTASTTPTDKVITVGATIIDGGTTSEITSDTILTVKLLPTSYNSTSKDVSITSGDTDQKKVFENITDDLTGEISYLSSDKKPEWITIDTTGDIISVQVTDWSKATVGTYVVEVTAQTATSGIKYVINVEIKEDSGSNEPEPTTGSISATKDAPLSVTVGGTENDTAVLTAVSVDSPVWTVSPDLPAAYATGVVSTTTTSNDTYTITVYAASTDAAVPATTYVVYASETVSKSITITVSEQQQLSFAITEDTNANNGVQYPGFKFETVFVAENATDTVAFSTTLTAPEGVTNPSDWTPTVELSGDTKAVISGTLPDVVEEYGDSYQFEVSARDGTNDPVTETLYVTVQPITDDMYVSDATDLEAALGSSYTTVNENYSVQLAEGYTALGEILPDWVEVTSSNPYTLAYKAVTGITRGTKSTAQVLLENGTILSWDLTYDGPENPALAISGDSISLSAAADGSDNATLDVTASTVASWDFNPPVPDAFALTVTSTDTIVTVAIAPAATATTQEYTGTITFTDAFDSDPVSVNLTLSITAEEPGPGPQINPLSVTPTAAQSVTIAHGETSSPFTFTAANNSGDVTWTAEATAGITPSSTSGSGATFTFTITADRSATAGNYTVTVTANDARGTPVTRTINVTVRPATPDIRSLVVEAEPNEVSVAIGGRRTVELTASYNGTPVTGVSYTPLVRWVTVSDGVATIAPTANDDGLTVGDAIDVIISASATDGGYRYEGTTSVRVTITSSSGGGLSSSGGGCDAGFGALALLLAAPLFLRKKRS